MLDIKWIRECPEDFDKNLSRRGQAPLARELLTLDEQHRNCITKLQDLQNERNNLAKQIGQAKSRGEDAENYLKRSQAIKELFPALEAEEQNLRHDIFNRLAALPNILEPEVPDGQDETGNQTVHSWGDAKKFSFKPKSHDELGETLGMMDFSGAAKISGARFVILKGHLALLERALASFMLDLHMREFGYTLVSPPLLVREEALFGTGQLPKLGEEAFRTTDGRWLIPTSEVPLTNIVREEILDYQSLPLRFVCYSPCFRSEAGAAGRDTRGMIRQHQFHKVELVSIVHPDHSGAEHERMTQAAETVLQRLGLPYRKMLLCSGDTGSSMRKTYDLEVWIPSENTYREISSCSSAGDFQARRMNARLRDNPEGRYKALTRFVHTLNGSGVAVGRALVAVLENYQQEDGSIVIPEVLRPYMNGQTVIRQEQESR